ncbi:MAG: glycosyltransferase [Rhodopseudomonas sp.]|nr:glycosyltransferase [Rhodopseudomonas sp.]
MASMAGRRIVIVCGAGYVSGKEIASLNLAQSLRAAGHDVAFIVSAWSDGDFPRRLEDAGFACCRLRLGFVSMTLSRRAMADTLNQLLHWPALLLRYRRAIRQLRADAVIHTNWHHALLLLPLLRPARDVFWMLETAASRWRFARVYGAIAARTAGIVAISQAVWQSLRAIGVPADRLRIVYLGVPAAPAIEPPGLQPVLRFGIVGQVGAWKGHDDLIDAVALAVRAGAPVCLRIFGSGDPRYVASLKRRIAELDIGDRIEWCGFRQSQRDIFAGIDVCVMPSRFVEPFGLSAVEAGSYGRPVICTARGGLIEIVQDGVTGLVVAAESPDRLAAAIVRLAHDRDLVRRMGAAARARARREFSLETSARQFAQCLPAPVAAAAVAAATS